MVSVCMISYGHEKFIREAVEGVLMQVCDCEVELIIADDCSPDETSRVVQGLIRNHPNGRWIRYTRHKANMGMLPNFLFALQEARGEYIAFCEGDDYWTDPLKIQKQLDVLEKDPSIALVHTDYALFKAANGIYNQALNKHKHIPTNSIYNELIGDNFIATLTVMVKTEILREATRFLANTLKQWPMVDYPHWLYISSQYKVAYLPQVTATYRYLASSASHSDALKKNLRFLKGVFSVRKYFLKGVKTVPLKISWKIYKSFYTESSLYIFRKLKQKIYAKP